MQTKACQAQLVRPSVLGAGFGLSRRALRRKLVSRHGPSIDGSINVDYNLRQELYMFDDAEGQATDTILDTHTPLQHTCIHTCMHAYIHIYIYTHLPSSLKLLPTFRDLPSDARLKRADTQTAKGSKPRESLAAAPNVA